MVTFSCEVFLVKVMLVGVTKQFGQGDVFCGAGVIVGVMVERQLHPPSGHLYCWVRQCGSWLSDYSLTLEFGVLTGHCETFTVADEMLLPLLYPLSRIDALFVMLVSPGEAVHMSLNVMSPSSVIVTGSFDIDPDPDAVGPVRRNKFNRKLNHQ